MINNLPSQYRKDPWILALAAALQSKLDGQGAEIAGIPAQMSLDTVTWNLAVEERLAGITPPAGATLEQRRAVLKSRWRSVGKVSLEQIQAVADSWHNGQVEVTFPSGKIVVQFVGDFGVPDDLDSLKNAIQMVIPAHLGLEFRFKYLLIRDVHQVKTLTEMQQLELNMFAGGASQWLATRKT